MVSSTCGSVSLLLACFLIATCMVRDGLAKVRFDNLSDLDYPESMERRDTSDKTLKYCSFNQDDCGYTFTQDYFQKIFIDRLTRPHLHQTGPARERTWGSPKTGYYVGVNSERSQSHTDILLPSRFGSAKSPKQTTSGDHCLIFFYSMYGADVLAMRVVTEVDGKEQQLLTSLDRIQDRKWRMAKHDFMTDKPFKLSFEFTIPVSGGSKLIKADAAIDDVYLYNKKCDDIAFHQVNTPFQYSTDYYTYYYTFHSEKKTWKDAYTFCRNQGPYAFLATMDAPTLKFMKGNTGAAAKISSSANGYYTSGANEPFSRDSFHWTSQDDYVTIGRTQPKVPVSANRFCLVVDGNHQLDAIRCNKKRAFICESRNKIESNLG